MKKLSVLFVFMAICFSVAFSDDNTTLNRVVLTAAHEFDELYVSGDATVEICYNTRHAGLIVYNNTDKDNERIRCYNDGSKLFVDGHCNRHDIKSRVVVFFDKPLNRIVNNGTGTILARRIPKDSSLEVVLNGTGTLKLGKKLSLNKLTLIANGSGDIHIPQMKATDIEIRNNVASNISVSKLKAKNAGFVVNGTGSVTVSGKANDAIMTVNGSGAINAYDMHCESIKAQRFGSGTITIKDKPKNLEITGNPL